MPDDPFNLEDLRTWLYSFHQPDPPVLSVPSEQWLPLPVQGALQNLHFREAQVPDLPLPCAPLLP